MADNVNHPAHYETGKFECIDVMVETQSEKALNTYYAERNERIGLEDTATSIAALMQQAYSLTESFKEKVKAEYPGVDTLCGYYGSISYKLANMSSQAEIRSCLL